METAIKKPGAVAAVIGAQWGDEGKGKITDILSERFDIIARACGGANAGHTTVVDGKKRVFHLLPSGCLRDGKQVVLGGGMVIHLQTLLEEINTLRSIGIDIVPRMLVSRAAHIVFDYHKEIDRVVEERRRGGNAIGTTMRGIGPAYADKAYRTGMRMGDIADGNMREIGQLLKQNAGYANKMFGIDVDISRELSQLRDAKNTLEGKITDTAPYLHSIAGQKRILIEGAQATMLDIDHGTYPHVTSSSTTVMGAMQALGLPPRYLTSCIGVAKAYCTRVGNGPFLTEIEGRRGDALRKRGGEYGATTGRPRRCGWMDIGALRFATRINGFTSLNITKLDVLDEEEEIPVYDDDEITILKGWRTPTCGITNFSDLPENARNYVEYVEKAIGVPAAFIGTGAGRKEMIIR